MSHIKTKFATLLLLVSAAGYAQLGFCAGSKGDPVFSENFGNGTTYGPALPAGITTYPFVTGAPNDGFYTLFYHSNLYSTWHYSLDHTPDAANGANGKMLIVNASAGTSGDFYKKTVSGLCVNTTFEFSSWLLNVYNPNSNFCGAGQIPINVRFEIWNQNETVLLGSGNTGNIMGTPAPVWQQFALVFTTANETSVVLKMKNNGVGGCGNDLAIDDIEFRSCGDLTTVSSPLVAGDTYSSCNSPVSLELHAATLGGSPYFYQWQTSTDATNWTDIAGANSSTYITPNLSSLTYFRVKAAQDAANLSNNFCSSISNVFTVAVLPAPNPGISNGDQVICSNQTIPSLSVTAEAGTSVNWYDAPAGGALLQSGNASYTPTAAGTYYAETYNSTTNCIGSPRTPVALTIVALPDAAIAGTASVCSGNTATVSFSGTPHAIVTYTADGGTNQTATLDASGSASITTPALAANSTYTLVSCTSADLSTCIRIISDSVTIAVNSLPTASVSSNSPVCYGTPATVNFSGTPDAVVTYSANGGPGQAVVLDAAGNASIVVPGITSAEVYSLIEVTSAGATGCTQALSQSITVSAVPLPTAAISANPSSICSNQTATIAFSGTPHAIVTYTVDGGTNQTATLDASGSASITTPALAANSTYTLVSCTSADLSTCSSIINDSVTIAVNDSPTASVSSNSPVCYGTPATVNFSGTPNAVVTYSANGGPGQAVVLDAAGNASIVVPGITSAEVYSLIDVTSAGATGCTQVLSQSITVSAVPLLTASLSANPPAICSNQTSTLNFSGTPNAVVAYSVNGGGNQSVTLGSSGSASITVTPLQVTTTYQLVSVALAGTGCSELLSDTVVVSVNPTPNVIYNGDLTYCEGESVAVTLASDTAGTTFSWTVSQNGTAGAVSGSGNQITQTVTLENDTAGTVTYTVTPFYNGCTGTPAQINVTIHPLPVPEIVDGVICLGPDPASGQPYVLNTNLDPAGHSFQWYFQGNPIPGASGNTYGANQIGVYTVVATNDAGCASVPVDAVVSEMPRGESLVVQQSAAFSDNPTVTVTVIGADGPFLYQLDDSSFQSSNVFHSVPAGTHTITVVDACTHLTATVTIIDYPKYFTPNGDGIHDTWNIAGIDAVIRIFDRYGKLLKQISPNGSGWDGTYNGRLLPSTDYWFTIGYAENGENKTFRAHFALKR